MRFVITAGPTREPIDPVRFLSNRSSGKMGYAIAEAAAEGGHNVVLISGPVNLEPPPGVEVLSISTGEQMYETLLPRVTDADIIVMCAAVADYKPATVAAEKIKKQNQPLSLTLVPTRDILSTIGRGDRSFLLVGFAAETEDIEKNAREKLWEKNCDIIVANDVSSVDFGMEANENEVMILFRNRKTEKIARAPKKNIARELVKIFANTREKCLTKNVS